MPHVAFVTRPLTALVAALALATVAVTGCSDPIAPRETAGADTTPVTPHTVSAAVAPLAAAQAASPAFTWNRSAKPYSSLCPKGIQAVLLASWSDASVKNAAGVVAATPGTCFEIAFAPYIQDDDVHGDARQYATVAAFVSQVEAARAAAGKPALKLYVTVQFGFHHCGGQGDRDEPSAARFRERVREFRDRVYPALKDRVTFVLSPSLEDECSTTKFEDLMETILTEMFDVVPTDRQGYVIGVYGRRVVAKSGTAKGLVTAKVGTTSKKFRVQLERHGLPTSVTATTMNTHTTGYSAYSNDGNFVYLDRPAPNTGALAECGGSMDNADPNDKAQASLTTFASATKKLKRTVLLWRPAYNLIAKGSGGSCNVRYTKSDRSRRRDSDDTPAFGASEKDALRQFLAAK